MSFSWNNQKSSLRSSSNTTNTTNSNSRTLDFARSHSQPSAISSSLTCIKSNISPSPSPSSVTTIYTNNTITDTNINTRLHHDASPHHVHKTQHKQNKDNTHVTSLAYFRPQSSSGLSLRSLKSPAKRNSNSSNGFSRDKSNFLLTTKATECNHNNNVANKSTLALGSCTASLILSFYDSHLDRCLDQAIMSSNNDSKFKSYVQAVDRALKSFEYTSEWADLVNALNKFNRVIILLLICKIDCKYLIFYSGSHQSQQIPRDTSKVYCWAAFGTMYASIATVRCSPESTRNIRSHIYLYWT